MSLSIEYSTKLYSLLNPRGHFEVSLTFYLQMGKLSRSDYMLGLHYFAFTKREVPKLGELSQILKFDLFSTYEGCESEPFWRVQDKMKTRLGTAQP